jgi:transcriptional regulator with XRE-family HTH domain
MDKNTDVIYAHKLHFLRRSANIKQPEIAEVLNISQQAYSKLERGETHFSDEIIDAICDYFKITAPEFMQTSESINCVNSPNSGNNNNSVHSPYNALSAEIMTAFLAELKSSREERKFFMQSIERMVELIKK